MILRNLFLLFALLILIGCNQTDSDSIPSADNTNNGSEQSQSGINENAATAETEPEKAGKVVARVNGKPIYEDDLNGRDLEDVINDEIIYQEGIRQGMDKEFRDDVKDYERRLILKQTKLRINENAEPAKNISDEEIKNYYENNKVKYSQVRIHEISFPDSNLGNEIREKAKSEEDLKTVANSYPDIAINVNDIGFNRTMLQYFEIIEVGSVSDVIQKPDGTFSVLKIVDVKNINSNASKAAIKYLLEKKQRGQIIKNYAQNISDENNMTIEIIEQNIDQ